MIIIIASGNHADTFIRRDKMKKGLGNFKIRKGVFYPLCAIYLIVILLGVFMPEAFAAFENGVVSLAAGWFGCPP